MWGGRQSGVIDAEAEVVIGFGEGSVADDDQYRDPQRQQLHTAQMK